MTGAPQTLVDVSGTLRLAYGGEACDVSRTGAIRYTGGDFSFCRNGSAWETLATVASASDRIVSGTSSVIVNSATSTISFSTAGYTMGWMDGAGVLSVRGRLDIVTGTNVVAVGAAAAKNNTGSNLTALGYGTAQNNTGSHTTAVGYIVAQNNTGMGLTAIGSNAGRYNSGSYVVALGMDAAYSNTASAITAVGYKASQNNTGSNTTVLGGYAAYNNTGQHLAAVGYGSGWSNSGTQVTVIGAYAGQDNTGNYVAALGYMAAASNTFSNVVALGHNAQPTKMNQVMLGNTATDEVFSYGAGIFNKYVRPGSATTVSLPAASSAGAGAIMYDTTLGGLVFSNGSVWTAIAGGGGASADRITSGTSAVVVNSATGSISFTTAGSTGVVITSSSLVGVGTSNPSAKLDVSGTVSTTDVFLAKTSGQCSTAADIGRMFRSATTGRLQICADRN